MTEAGADKRHTAGPAPPDFRARNLVAAAQWMAVGVLGLSAFFFRPDGLGLLGGAIGVYALHAAFEFWVGVSVDNEGVMLPRPLFGPVPLLVLGRVRVLSPLIRDLVVAGRFMGLDVVLLETTDASIPTLFASRAKRLTFFDAVKESNPDVKIYRAK
jgi:hypothetical protein